VSVQLETGRLVLPFPRPGDAQLEPGRVLARERWGTAIRPDSLPSQPVAARIGAQPADTMTLFDSRPAVVREHGG
jgi:hypothetical protein